MDLLLEGRLIDSQGPRRMLQTARLNIAIRSQHRRGSLRSASPDCSSFRVDHQLVPGTNVIRIPLAELARRVELTAPLVVRLKLEHADRCATFQLDRLRMADAESAATATTSPIGALIWDLDQTIWTGSIAQDGLENLTLQTGVRNVLDILDRSGITMAVATRCTTEQADAAMAHFGIGEYFRSIQCGDQKKSRSVLNIVRQLDLSLDEVAFIDDSPWERSEILSVCPQVRVFDAAAYAQLPSIIFRRRRSESIPMRAAA